MSALKDTHSDVCDVCNKVIDQGCEEDECLNTKECNSEPLDFTKEVQTAYIPEYIDYGSV